MAEFDKETREIVARLQAIRVKMLREQPFYAVLLMHLRFAIDESTPTAYTDGERIAFNPYFIKELDDFQLQFVLMHEILHVVLLHHTKDDVNCDYTLFNIACDIVVNSNIMYSLGMIKEKKDASGKKVFEEVRKVFVQDIEVIHNAPDGREGVELTAEEVYEQLLLVQNKSQKKEKKETKGKGKGIESEEIYSEGENPENSGGNNTNEYNKDNNSGNSSNEFDDHSFWGSSGSENDREENQNWTARMIDATEIAEQITNEFGSTGCGSVPLAAERVVKELTEAQTDWRTVLENFIQEEINDYSFSPPDRRFEDSSFFLPDFNEKDEKVEDILFMIDTSGSMSDTQITAAYSEIKGAIDQFDGKLKGWLGFFDAVVVEPQEFEDEDEFSIIRPVGGGGTNFQIIFDHVNEKMKDTPPASIIILTDGYAPFPDEKDANGIPVLWIINNENITPPWGKVCRITEN